tara:strand:+ start:3802 stop:5283 length:1482 start_codon:yes stop_codon:yes gene_type:complete
MFDLQKFQFNKLLQIISSIFIILGIVFRFYHQFIEWSFNGDEVNLGLDIINHSYKNLFHPFQSRQSAPPLFLLIEKLTSEVSKPFVSLKIINFLASCASIFLFNRILKKSLDQTTQIILIALFCFNPFIISNSLTLKQYSVDLMMGLIAVNYYLNKKPIFKIFLFFCFFCWISNVGLFFSASFLIFNIIKTISEHGLGNFFTWKRAKKLFPYLLAPIPYLIFYFWFINQPGAENMKSYMVYYWEGSFLPLNLSIFKWIAIQGKVIYYFFYSTYWLVGIPMLVLFIFSLSIIFRKKQRIFQELPFAIILVYMITVGVHVFLSALKMYPFSDRLFLYMVPGIYLVTGIGIEQLYRKLIVKWNSRLNKMLILIFPIIAIALYITYLPKKSNDVYGLIGYVNSTNKTIFFTPKAKQTALQWLEFTKYEGQNTTKIIHSKAWDTINNIKPDLLIAVQSKKFGHTKNFTTPEPEIEKLIKQEKIVLCHRLDGYVIYKFK